MYSRKGDHITEIFDQVRGRMTGSGADGGQAVQYDMCSLFFGHFFKGLFAVLGYHGDYICFGAESGTAGSKGVGTDHITVLGSKFFPGIFQQVFGFHGKAADDLARLFLRSEGLEDINGTPERYRHVSIGLFYLVLSDGCRGVIGNGCRFDDDVLLGSCLEDSFSHLGRRTTGQAFTEP